MPISRSRRITALFLLGTALPVAAFDDPLLNAPELPTVLSASRLKQAPTEVPGSMTVIDRELIRATGARDIPEILRLVPGMMIGYRRGNQINVNYHGTNVTEARRLQVLIDGRSVYRPGLATVDWTEIPLAIEDIEHIEVFRGPNTAAYGANALMGVINIVTRHPRETLGSTLKITRGKRGVNDWYASQGTAGENSHWRLSLSGQEDDGFDHFPDGRDYRDGRRLSRINLSSSLQLSANQTLDWQAAASETNRQSYYEFSPFVRVPNPPQSQYDRVVGAHTPPADISGKDYALQGLWKIEPSPDHSFQLMAYAQHMERLRDWRVCNAPVTLSPELRRINQLSTLAARRVSQFLRPENIHRDMRTLLMQTTDGQYTEEIGDLADIVKQKHLDSLDSDPACWDIDQNIRETRYQLELQDTRRLSHWLRMVNGISYRHDQASSRTFFAGTVKNDIVQVFSNIEVRPHQRLLLQAGGMYEDASLIGTSFSPRLAANLFIAPQHSLRLVYSEAVRSPDMYENNAHWTYQIKNLSGPLSGPQTYYAVAYGPGNLQQEKMRSKELGYNGQFHHLGLAIDIRVFREQINDMISEPLRVDDFLPNNDASIRFRGVETQLDWRLTRRDRLRLTHAQINFEASSRFDQRLTARHSGSAAWLRQWPAGFESSLIYYGADKLNERRFERLDSRLAKRFALGNNSSMELALTWQHRLDDEALTWSENLYDSRNHYYLSAELNF